MRKVCGAMQVVSKAPKMAQAVSRRGAAPRSLTTCVPRARQAGAPGDGGDIERRMSPGRSISPFINDVFGSIPSPFDMLNQLDTESRALTAACDVVESDSTYTISLEAPGMDKDDLKIELEDNNTLVISGEKSASHDNTNNTVRRVERTYGSFSRRWQLPKTVDPSKITAKMNKGVLEVTVPKGTEPKSSTTIDIAQEE